MMSCECINKVLSLTFENKTFKVYGDLKQDNEITIKYNGYLINEETDTIYIQYGYGNSWENKETLKMNKCNLSDDNIFCCTINLLEFEILNLAFMDNNNNWDLNNNSSYSLEIQQKENILTKKIIDLTLEDEFEKSKWCSIIKNFKEKIFILFKNIGIIFKDKKIEE